MQNVCGELYEVDDKMLTYLDKVEAVPLLYNRCTTFVRLQTGSAEPVACFVYLLSDYNLNLLSLPFRHFYDAKQCAQENIPYSFPSNDINDVDFELFQDVKIIRK